jgi:thiamine-phosphate pyrophosphorylase
VIDVSVAHKDKLKGLYAITDENLIPEKLFKQSVESALQGGCKIIQYRDKSNDHKKRFQQASMLQSLCEQYQAISIINDDIELARKVNANGVHLGKDDRLISEARETLGENVIIGISCYNDIKLAISAEKNSADYVAFGAMFTSTTKPGATSANLELISTAKQKLTIPVCAIGGITEKNILQLIQQGSDMTAVINSLFANDDVKAAANRLSKFFN